MNNLNKENIDSLEESIWKEKKAIDFSDVADEIQKKITPTPEKPKEEPIEPIKAPEEKPKKEDFFGDLGKTIQENINKDYDLESSSVVPQVLFKSERVKPKKVEPELPTAKPVEEIKKAPPKKKVTKLKEEEIKKTPELFTLNEFVPSIFNQNDFYNEEKSQNIDSSLTALEYLYSIGYKTAVWQLGPEYKEDNCHVEQGTDEPVCNLRSGVPFSIHFIIKNAYNFASRHNFGGNPPKAIISLSHSGCRCSLLCLKPDKPSQIPDSAPGIPLFTGDRKIVNKFKRNLLDKLQNINVDRWSLMLPAELENLEQMNQENSHLYTILQNPEQNKYSYYMTERIAKKEEEEWTEDIRPIQITENFIYNPLFRIIRPVTNSYIGFQLEKTEDKAKVYLSGLGYEIQVPKNIINYLELDPIEKEIDANSFVETEDGELGIILKAKDYEEPICYLPSFRTTMKIDGILKNLKIRGI